MSMCNPKRLLQSPTLHSDILSRYQVLSLPCFSCHFSPYCVWLQSQRNSWEISSTHTPVFFSLALSFLSFFSFFFLLEAKYEMPDTLATNLTQLKSKAHKDDCKFLHNKQSCCLNLKSKEFGKLHHSPQWSTGSKISRYHPSANSVAFYIQTRTDSSFLFKALFAPPLLFLVPLEWTLCLQIVMWSVPLLQGTEPECRYPATLNKYRLFRKAAPPAWQVPVACQLSFISQTLFIPCLLIMISCIHFNFVMCFTTRNKLCHHNISCKKGKKNPFGFSIIFQLEIQIGWRSSSDVFVILLSKKLQPTLSGLNLAPLHFQENTCCQRPRQRVLRVHLLCRGQPFTRMHQYCKRLLLSCSAILHLFCWGV